MKEGCKFLWFVHVWNPAAVQELDSAHSALRTMHPEDYWQINQLELISVSWDDFRYAENILKATKAEG